MLKSSYKRTVQTAWLLVKRSIGILN